MHHLLGTVLSGKYEVLEVVGTGGMAIVYKGRDIRLGREVAIKVLKAEYNNDSEFVKRFQTESTAIAQLAQHNNIVNVYDVGFTDEINYIVMELVKGPTLYDYLMLTNRFIPEDAILHIALQVASALKEAHTRGVVHRDIKAQNILLDRDGKVKVADFGIARASTAQTIHRSSEVFGSVHYTSPEQARGEDVDARSDIYSLGILLYELATKQLPFNADEPVKVAMMQVNQPLPDPRKINKDISPGLVAIIRIATQKNPLDRYQSAAELFDDLRDLKADRHFLPKPRELASAMQDNATRKFTAVSQDIDDLELPMPMEADEGGSKLNVVIAILSGIGLALLIIALMFVFNITKNFGDNTVRMIEVVGKDVREAVRMLQDIGIKADTSEYRNSNTVPENHVISSSIDAGTNLKRGYTVKLVVSSGDQKSTVPLLIDQPLERALEMLKGQKLEQGKVEYESSDRPDGTVIRQSPEAGRELAAGSSVDLVVSQGASQSTKVLVPPLASLSLRRADSTLMQLGLKLGETEYRQSADYPKGVVIANDLVGEMVDPGTHINVIVSSGPPPTEPTTSTETTAGDSTQDSTETTEATDPDASTEPTDSTEPSGNEMTEKTITIYLLTSNFDSETSSVRIDFVNAGEKKIVYQGEHSKNEGESIPINLSLKGRGQGKLFIYFGSFLKQEEDISF